MLRLLAKYFLRGILVIVPAAATIWVLYTVFASVDDLVRLPAQDWVVPFFGWRVPGAPTDVPGLGVLLTLVLITAVGFLASTYATRWLFELGDRLFTHMPFVKLLYGAIRDMIEAFVSDKKKFDKPVLLTVGEEMEVIGFITRESLEELGVEDRVAVYVPQSYNFAANLILVPADRVRPLERNAADVMTFVVSGGVATIKGGDRGNGK